jgi:hypothetical protein
MFLNHIAAMRTRRFQIFIWLGLLVAAGFGLCGCSTPETAENESERPWASPRSWEHGLPGFMNEGR